MPVIRLLVPTPAPLRALNLTPVYSGFVFNWMAVSTFLIPIFAILFFNLLRRRNWARFAWLGLAMMGVAAYAPTLREQLMTAPVLGALESLSMIFLVVGTAMFFTSTQSRGQRDDKAGSA